MSETDPGVQVLLYLLLITAAQGLVLAPIVAAQRPRHPSILFLALFFLLISLGCAEKAIEGIFLEQPHGELPIPLALPLAYFPAIYLHLSFLIDPERRFHPRLLLHFVPAVVMEFAAYYLVPGVNIYQGFVLTRDPQDVRAFFRFYDLFFVGHFAVYTRQLVNLRGRLADRTADDAVRVWVRWLLPILIVFWTSWAFVKFFGKTALPGYLLSYFIHGAAMACIYWFGFTFILQMKAPFARVLARRDGGDAQAGEMLIARIRESGLFRNRKLTLAIAAAELGLSRKAVSDAVGAGPHANFSDLINVLRIEAFKAGVAEPSARKLSLFGLAQEAGFASKASFHRAFRKHCGQTPGDYLAESGEKRISETGSRSQIAI